MTFPFGTVQKPAKDIVEGDILEMLSDYYIVVRTEPTQDGRLCLDLKRTEDVASDAPLAGTLTTLIVDHHSNITIFDI